MKSERQCALWRGTLFGSVRQRQTEAVKTSTCTTKDFNHKRCLCVRSLYVQRVAAETSTGCFLFEPISSNDPHDSHLASLFEAFFGVRLYVFCIYCSIHSLLTLDPESVAHKPPMRTAVSADAGTSIASNHAVFKVESWAMPIQV